MADPNLRADRASVVWLPSVNPATVIVAPAPAEFVGARSLAALTPAFTRRAADGLHLLLGPGCDALAVALTQGADVTVAVAIMMPFDGDPRRVKAVLQLEQAMMLGTPVLAPDFLTPQQRARFALIVRCLDGRLSGASHREVAIALFGPARIPTAAEWHTHDLRNRTRRLSNRGFALMNGGYLGLLHHRFRG